MGRQRKGRWYQPQRSDMCWPGREVKVYYGGHWWEGVCLSPNRWNTVWVYAYRWGIVEMCAKYIRLRGQDVGNKPDREEGYRRVWLKKYPELTNGDHYAYAHQLVGIAKYGLTYKGCRFKILGENKAWPRMDEVVATKNLGEPRW